MENYVCASLCVLILSLCGCLDGTLEKTRLSRADAAFAALCVLALSSFRFKPFAEFDIDVAALALPVVFALLSIRREGQASRLLARFALLCALPVAASAVTMLYELSMTTYAYFSLRARSVCLAQILLCALALAIASFRRSEEEAV